MRADTTLSRRALALALTMLPALVPASGHAQIPGGGARSPQDITGSVTPAARSAVGAVRASTQAQMLPPAQPAPPPSPPLPWSGQDGGSGHPLMTADAIRASAANFGQCVANYWPDASKRGVTRANFERFTAGLTPDLRIMDLMDSQPEFEKSIWDYLDILVTDARIARGREILAAYKPIFDAVEKSTGVDRYTITAIWGVESNYSTMGGDRSVVRSTATLACIGRRQPYFKDEFLTALEILNRGDLTPEQMKGSWAGAFGPTQFMPTAFKRFAVDGDGDGRRDVVDSVPDLIASTANNLKKDGWLAGQTWGYEVVLPQGFDYAKANRTRSMTIAQWEQSGIRRAGGRPFASGTDSAFLLLPGGAGGPGFLMMQNFRAILRYNPADAYAMAIGHLADRLRGGGPFVQPWPREERTLSRAEKVEMQQHLASRGFYQGDADGQFGGRSRDALRNFQVAAGLPADGFASVNMLERLRGR